MADNLDDLGGAFERAAATTARSVRPRGFTTTGRQETVDPDPYAGLNFFIPQSPLDLAAMFALGPGGRVATRAGALALGGLLSSDEAQAGPASKLLNLGEGLIGLGAFPTTTPRRILKETKGGGYSVRLPTGEIPSEGIMSGIYRNADPRNLVIEGRAPTLADIGKFAETNLPALQKDERYFGTWLDPETGTTYLDVSQRFPAGAVRPATKFAERTAQKSIYDIGFGTRPVGSWDEFIRSPEFADRVRQMAQEGGEYLSKFPQREWWDMYGSPFEAVYGTKNLPQVAGFTASTAPNTAPIQNLQQMSEYMRRFIRGEPVVQPSWRAPEGLMSLAEGKQLPLEQSRVLNLQRTERGALDELSRRKVRNEALAMMGDPNAMVFDRHWARVAEKPSAGIYTSSQEGVISSAPRAKGPSDYEMLENVVGPLSAEAKRNPRDYSADAWTGIRNTIQQTGQLFGEKFRGSAITGESKSYADHFTDLIRTKAEHLGMSVMELEKRLRNGDANLLSTMLGAPTIAAAYRYWAAGQDQGQNGSASSADNRATPPAL